MKKLFIEIVDTFLNTFKYATNDMIILPGSNLVNAFKYSGLIAFLSFGCWALDLPFFIDWKGALGATIILGLVSYLGRKEND